MWCAIKINKNSEKCIPVRWIKDFSHVRTYNIGLKPNTKYTVFYSTDLSADPVFENNLLQENRPNTPASYAANVSRFFGKFPIKQICVSFSSFL